MARRELPLDTIFDLGTLETVEQSPVAHVSRARMRQGGLVVAIKSAAYEQEFSKQPHDICKEVELLSRICHPNIIEILGNTLQKATSSLHYWMPFVEWSLYDLLANPDFSPHTSSMTGHSSSSEFTIVARSLLQQVLKALAYLHSNSIAHRDVKPRNVLITRNGCAKLIDFGISWDTQVSPSDMSMWPEPPGGMCPHVCSGPYRAPETIFGATNYDPFAVDMWSFGVLCADFFCPLRFVCEDELSDDGFLETEEATSGPVPSHIVPDDYWRRRGYWSRDSLFDASKGSIGLAWSIFKVKGTPNDNNWPSFSSLPDANKVTFIDAEPVDLGQLLPNLPPPPEAASALDFINQLLVYPPDQRMEASEALQHPWLTHGTLLMPGDTQPAQDAQIQDDQSLGRLLQKYLAAVRRPG